MSDSQSPIPIPQVPEHLHGLLGNLPDIDPGFFFKSIWHLTELYGPVFQLNLLNRHAVIVANYECIKDIQDDTRFEKQITGVTLALRPFIGDGLFTAFTHEKNWAKAHRILMPVFGPLAIRKMFDQQMDIASQMILKWDRLGPTNEIMCSDDFTRLAFDTIAFCSFSYRFNEFYGEHVHPWASKMADALLESGKRANRTSIENSLRYWSDKKLHEDIQYMHKLCDDIVEDRLRNPQPENKDLLNTMLNVADSETGEKLDKENIRFQMATFLVAGHETTSGTLSFLFYNILHHPDTYHKAQREVDEVVGDDALTLDHISKLKYVDACIKETLRYMGPISGIQQHSKGDELIAGKYAVNPDVPVICSLRGLHHDPAVWGDDADQFKPERMLDMSNIPNGAWKPFGFGMRACIGRTFAEQEMMIATALILQRFQVEMANPAYNLELKSTLTIKPLDFAIRVRRRPGKSMMVGLEGHTKEKDTHAHGTEKTEVKPGKKLTILYGSNAGTCRAYADELSANAEEIGFTAEVKTLDSATEALPTDHPVVIIAPSYEGKPADNAKKFCSWLEVHSGDKGKLKDVKYLLFGVGNSEWAATFHKVPKIIDHSLTEMGAKSIVKAGYVDVKTDTVGPWDEWCSTIWPALTGSDTAPSEGSTLKARIEKSTSSKLLGGFESAPATVKENIQLADKSVGPEKMHMEVYLPDGVTYRSGDYLVVIPFNPRDDTLRVIRRFKLNPDDVITITDTRKEYLKTQGTSVYDLLMSRVELSTPITQRQLEKLAGSATDSEDKDALEKLCKDDQYQTEILKKRFSILDILEDYPSCKLEFTEYLDLLKPLTPRQYSISSSPLAHQNVKDEKMTASISYDVIESPALSGGNRTFYGTASTYLASVKPGAQINCTVRPANAAFHLPQDTTIPIIMIAAGTGIAPMRGFIQERAALIAAGGKKVGPALLYFGCRDYESDYIYKKELEHWESEGAVSLRPCFSKRGPDEKSHGHTSDRLWADKDEVAELFLQGGKIFICGSASKVAKSTAETCLKIYKEKTGKSQEEAEAWLDRIKEDRYVSDVFG